MIKNTCYPGKCEAGEYADLEKGGCTPCQEGTYSLGGVASSCTCCPNGYTVAEGDGLSEDHCTSSKIYNRFKIPIVGRLILIINQEISSINLRFPPSIQKTYHIKILSWYLNFYNPVSCDAGLYVDASKCATCSPCQEGTYSLGGVASSCTCCPNGYTVAEGNGLSEDHCASSKIYNPERM